VLDFNYIMPPTGYVFFLKPDVVWIV